MNNAKVTVSATDKQLAFIQGRARELLLSGGYGSGKSLALALKLAMRATTPNAHELLIRKFNVTIARSTLRTLLDGDGMTPAILPSGTYTHQRSRQQVKITGGGLITYTGCDEPERLGSLNATGAAIDEAAELSEADYRMIRGRVRVTVPKLTPQIYAATNPSGPLHHLALRFGLDGQSKPSRGCDSITVRTDENPYLPAEYVADLGAMSGADRAKYFEGRWIAAEGLVYPNFDRRAMIQHRAGPWSRVVVGQDAGFNDPDALIVVCMDEAGRIHVADEFCESGQLFDAIIDRARDFHNRCHVELFAVDPSAARLREAMAQAGLTVVKAENPILDGIRSVQRFMVCNGEGVPSFTIEPHCEHTIRELESYRWNPNRTDVPLDRDNHCMDALRYAVMELDGTRSELGAVMLGTAEDVPDDPDFIRRPHHNMIRNENIWTPL